MHKRIHFITNKLKQKREDNNLITVKVDKGKICVIIDKITLNQKVQEFLQENQYVELKLDPTPKYTKQLKKGINRSERLIEKRKRNC